MLKKIVLISSLVFVLVITYAYSQEDMKFVSNNAFEKPQRPSSVFVHDTHNEMAELEDNCAICHHVYDDNGKQAEGESSEDSPCAECHGLKKEGNVPSLMNAYHKNCISCHKKEKKGPLACGECHVKQ